MLSKPIVVIGMHRSGTSLISQIMGDLGVFMGAFQESNHESYFFLDINKWLFSLANASWDNPENMNYINEYYINNAVPLIRRVLKSLDFVRYSGLRRYLQFRFPRQKSFSWGWKDPRNTFTADVWKKIYPDAKFLIVLRNPADVVKSLVVREEKIRQIYEKSLKMRLRRIFKPKSVRLARSFRIQNISQAHVLWKQYVRKALEIAETYKSDSIVIRYENLLEIPEKVISEISQALEISATHMQIKNASNRVKSDKCYSFLNDHIYKSFYYSIKDDPFLIEVGYNNIL